MKACSSHYSEVNRRDNLVQLVRTWCLEFAAMYSSNVVGISLVFTLLFVISYQYVREVLPDPDPRDPPDQSKHYNDSMVDDVGLFDKWACARGPVLYMRWPDRIHRPNQSDLWFDRLVYIHHEGHYDYILNNFTTYDKVPSDRDISELSITLNGVIFDHDRILTSYNPFRQIIKYAFKRHFTHVCILDKRKMITPGNDTTTRFRTTIHSIACARQVVPVLETKTPEDLWHGKTDNGKFIRQHSPLHDLMVIRTKGFIEGMTKDNYDFDFFLKQTDFYVNGPQKTYLAKADDVMGSDFKFAMMGHIFRSGVKNDILDNIRNYNHPSHKEEVKRMRDTYVGKYTKSDNALVDCDEWIPREWGWFICVLNKHGLRRLASGAALYSRGLLFGIGSFTLYKGDQSILVFTDVRPYESLITDNETGPCTTRDQFVKTHL